MTTSTRKPLTAAQTKGTKTFYLPLDRSQNRSPEVTLMFRPVEEGKFAVGVTVCSRLDQFEKHAGRKRAYHRLHGIPAIGTPDELATHLINRLAATEANRPGTLSEDVFRDVETVCNSLPDAFSRRRLEEAARSASE